MTVIFTNQKWPKATVYMPTNGKYVKLEENLTSVV